MMVIIGSEIALYAGRRPGKVRFSRNDPRSYSPEGRRDIRQRYRQERMDENMTQAEQEENIKQMQQEIVDAQEQIDLEQAQMRNLEMELASTVPNVEESEVAEQKSFLANKLAQAKEKISTLKDIIVNNKGKIIAAIAALGALGGGYLAYQAMQNPDGREKVATNPAVEVPLNSLEKKEENKKAWWNQTKAAFDKIPFAELEPDLERHFKEMENKIPNYSPEKQADELWALEKGKEYIEARRLAEQNQKNA